MNLKSFEESEGTCISRGCRLRKNESKGKYTHVLSEKSILKVTKYKCTSNCSVRIKKGYRINNERRIK